MDLQLYSDILRAILQYGHVDSDASLRADFVGPLHQWRPKVPKANSPFDRARLLIDFLAGEQTVDAEPALALYLDHCAGLLHEDDAGRSELTSLAAAVRQLAADGGLAVPPVTAAQTETIARAFSLQPLLKAAASLTSGSARWLLYGATAAVAASILQVDPTLMGLSPTVANIVTTINQSIAASPPLAALVGAIGGDAVVTILQRVGFRETPNAKALARDLEQALSVDISSQLQGLGRQLVDDPYFQQQFRDLVTQAIVAADVATKRDVYAIERTRQRDELRRQAELLDLLRQILSQLPGRRPPEPDLPAALALLDQLPTDHVPAPAHVPPHSRLAFPDDPNFTGREDQLKRLAADLKQGQSVAIGQPVAVSGLGGIGKSSLANAFAHRYGRFFAGGVFWLSFADPAAVTSEIAACGRSLSLRPDYDALDLPAQVALTQRAWQEELPRLLIFDNCEDEKLLDDYRPATGGCRVLVTSRNAVWDPARGLYTLHLQTLPRPDSIAFLRKLAPRLTDDGAASVAAELGDFPLALHLAGSYLARYRRVTPAAYVRRLQESNPLEHASLQGRGSNYNPTRHERNVHKTFLLSLDRLDVAGPVDALARDLLHRAACFAPGEPIPHYLLLAALPRDDNRQPEDVADALERLLALGLLEPAAEEAVRLHRLLAAFVQLLGIDDAIHIAVEQAAGRESARLLEAGRPVKFMSLLTHLLYLRNTALHRAEDAHSAWLSNQCATVARAGGFDAEFVRNLNMAAALLVSQGKVAAASPYYERAFVFSDMLHGPYHPSLVDYLDRLAEPLFAQGDYSAARRLYESAVVIREKALGPDHPDTALSLNNLAVLLSIQGNTAAARPLFERALAIREQTLGPDDPDTALSLSNLAHLLKLQGTPAAARPLYERALAIREQALGPDHPDTGLSLYNLALLYDAQGNTAAARPFFERALAIREPARGIHYPKARIVRWNLELLNAAAEEQ